MGLTCCLAPLGFVTMAKEVVVELLVGASPCVLSLRLNLDQTFRFLGR